MAPKAPPGTGSSSLAFTDGKRVSTSATGAVWRVFSAAASASIGSVAPSASTWALNFGQLGEAVLARQRVLAIGELRSLGRAGRPPRAQPFARDGVARLGVLE